jgi:hypothetical protein
MRWRRFQNRSKMLSPPQNRAADPHGSALFADTRLISTKYQFTLKQREYLAAHA